MNARAFLRCKDTAEPNNKDEYDNIIINIFMMPNGQSRGGGDITLEEERKGWPRSRSRKNERRTSRMVNHGDFLVNFAREFMVNR